MHLEPFRGSSGNPLVTALVANSRTSSVVPPMSSMSAVLSPFFLGTTVIPALLVVIITRPSSSSLVLTPSFVARPSSDPGGGIASTATRPKPALNMVLARILLACPLVIAVKNYLRLLEGSLLHIFVCPLRPHIDASPLVSYLATIVKTALSSARPCSFVVISPVSGSPVLVSLPFDVPPPAPPGVPITLSAPAVPSKSLSMLVAPRVFH